MLLSDLRKEKLKLEQDIAAEVIKLTKEFKANCECDIKGIEFGFSQMIRPNKNNEHIITRVNVSLVI